MKPVNVFAVSTQPGHFGKSDRCILWLLYEETGVWIGLEYCCSCQKKTSNSYHNDTALVLSGHSLCPFPKIQNETIFAPVKFRSIVNLEPTVLSGTPQLNTPAFSSVINSDRWQVGRVTNVYMLSLKDDCSF